MYRIELLWDGSGAEIIIHDLVNCVFNRPCVAEDVLQTPPSKSGREVDVFKIFF